MIKCYFHFSDTHIIILAKRVYSCLYVHQQLNEEIANNSPVAVLARNIKYYSRINLP